MSTKSSSGANKHNYLKPEFWLNKKNHFWETDAYSQKGKEVCRKRIEEVKKELYPKINLINKK